MKIVDMMEKVFQMRTLNDRIATHGNAISLLVKLRIKSVPSGC